MSDMGTVTVAELRELAADCGSWLSAEAAMLRAAATIEALQRQLDDVIDNLEHWVPSAHCSEAEIAQARVCGRMLVSTNNLGIVKRSHPDADDGHEWMLDPGLLSTPFCRLCGIVKRRDGQNKPCRGAVGISLRADHSDA